jgi:hypothetical protein
MRKLWLIVIVLFLAGCQGTQAYTKEDLVQVRQAAATIKPIYLQFRHDYFADDTPAVLRDYAQEQRACKLVDLIDKRDTIDPNVDLFQASAELDDLCNAIESAYVYWAKKHGYPYDKTVVPGRKQEVFLGSDADLKTLPKYLRTPRALS